MYDEKWPEEKINGVGSEKEDNETSRDLTLHLNTGEKKEQDDSVDALLREWTTVFG